MRSIFSTATKRHIIVVLLMNSVKHVYLIVQYNVYIPKKSKTDWSKIISAKLSFFVVFDQIIH